jgi:hypothetical protein
MPDLPPTRPRRRGRRPLDPRHPSVNVQFRLSTTQHDTIYGRSRAERVTFAEWIRRRLRVDPPRDQNQ